MNFHMLKLMNEWMMLVLMKCKCQMQCLTLGCYRTQQRKPTARSCSGYFGARLAKTKGL